MVTSFGGALAGGGAFTWIHHIIRRFRFPMGGWNINAVACDLVPTFSTKQKKWLRAETLSPLCEHCVRLVKSYVRCARLAQAVKALRTLRF